MADIVNYAQNLFNGTTFKRFERMPTDRKIDTVVKVAGVAALSGIVTGATLSAPISGTIVGGVSAFAYITTHSSQYRMISDFAVSNVKSTLNAVKNGFNNAVAFVGSFWE